MYILWFISKAATAGRQGQPILRQAALICVCNIYKQYSFTLNFVNSPIVKSQPSFQDFSSDLRGLDLQYVGALCYGFFMSVMTG